jgi:hypothetical protein
MIAVSIVKTYLFMNALLLVSYLLFVVLSKITSVVQFKASYRQLIAVGQILILLSILAPLSIQFIPQKHLPNLSWSAFHPASEGEEKSSVGIVVHPRHVVESVEHDRKIIDSPSIFALTVQWMKSDASHFAALIFVLLAASGFLLSIARLLRSIGNLRFTIRTASSVRAIGRVSIVVSEAITVPFSTRFLRTNWVSYPLRCWQMPGTSVLL